MLTITTVLVGTAFICTIAAAIDKCPLWVPGLLLVLVEMLRLSPR